jgi:hypothetical protein
VAAPRQTQPSVTPEGRDVTLRPDEEELIKPGSWHRGISSSVQISRGKNALTMIRNVFCLSGKSSSSVSKKRTNCVDTSGLSGKMNENLLILSILQMHSTNVSIMSNSRLEQSRPRLL